MTLLSCGARHAGGAAPAVALRRLDHYAPAVRDDVAAVAERHPRLADLATSFPALLYALARPRPGCDVAAATSLVISGAPLAHGASAAGVPMWLRRVPTKHLTHPLPRLPDAPLLAARIVNHLPSAPDAQAWLAAVAIAATCGHDLVAAWAARERVRDSRGVRLAELRLIAVWAWFCWHAGTIGHDLATTRWQPQMRFKTARDAAEDWREMLSLHLELPAPLADLWLQPGTLDGYEFVPLDSPAALAAEAAAMNNCVRTYADRVALNWCRLWSIRRDGVRVATLRVGKQTGPLLTILELRAAGNREAPVEVWWAATRWLNQHDLPGIDPQSRRWNTPPDVRTWRALWRPYWVAKGRIPAWLPLAPSRHAVSML